MAIFEVGRVCVKLAGRDAGKKCVIVEVKNSNIVVVDGETRRRPCNVKHLEPLLQTVELSKGASHDAVAKALKALGIEVKTTKPKKAAAKPKAVRKTKITVDEPQKLKKVKSPKAESTPVAEKTTKTPKAEKKTESKTE